MSNHNSAEFIKAEKSKIVSKFDNLEEKIKEYYVKVKEKSSPEIAPLKDYIIKEKKSLMTRIEDVSEHMPSNIKGEFSDLQDSFKNIYKSFKESMSSDETRGHISSNLHDNVNKLKHDIASLLERHMHSLEALPYSDRFISDPNAPTKLKHDMHIERKIFHFTGGLAIVLPFWLFSLTKLEAVLILGPITFITIFYDYMRLKHPALNKRFMKDFGKLMREFEKNKMSTTCYFMMSSLLAIIVFPKVVAALSILFLAAGDPIASAVGIKYGQTKMHWGKSLEGSFGCFLACTLISIFVLIAIYPTKPISVLAFSLIAGVIGAVAEMIPWKFDDNFSIPLVTGFCLTPIYIFLFILF
ncbi:MAG: hypothetical protein ABIA04_09240 [Pseudomonadota bacterium]